MKFNLLTESLKLKHKMKCGWIKWREASSILCDKRIPILLKSKFYKSVMGPTVLYDSDC